MQTKPVTLLPATVDKPWGREIWYSGIEARGESCVQTGNDTRPLSHFLASHGRQKPVTLLKTLHATAGHLYVEVHATKSEIYAVEQVSADEGMLLGVDQNKRRKLGDAGLRAALLAAAQAAEAADGKLDAVEALLERVHLRVGDVVTIPASQPHCLRHGSTVVEFQTPVFERKILAASQPVKTQASWDCAAAVDLMDLTAPPQVARGDSQLFPAPSPTPDAAFRLVRIAAGAATTVPPWSVGWVFRGAIYGADCRFAAGKGFLTPATTRLATSEDAVALIAVEKQNAG